MVEKNDEPIFTAANILDLSHQGAFFRCGFEAHFLHVGALTRVFWSSRKKQGKKKQFKDPLHACIKAYISKKCKNENPASICLKIPEYMFFFCISQV